MRNLRESFLLGMLTAGQRFFLWEDGLEAAAAVLAFTVIWWCLLTWQEEWKIKRAS